MPGDLPHLTITPFFTSRDYVYPKPGSGSGLELIERDRAIHANRIIQELNVIKQQFDLKKDEVLPQNIVKDDALYVEFYSELDFKLDFDKFNQDRDDPKFQLLNIRKEIISQNGEDKERYKVVVMMREGAVSTFLKKAGEYMTQNTKDMEKNDTGQPRHRALLNNIQSIHLATLRSFWTDEPEIPFPETQDAIWWEVWFRRKNDDANSIDRVLQNLSSVGAEIGQQTLIFPEHVIRLVKASAIQLSKSLMLLDNLAELRHPQQLNDFITNKNIDIVSKQQWQQDLLNRTTSAFDQNGVLIYLLDSGINNLHPLITSHLPDERTYAYKEAWGKEDTWPQGGHGTGMAGLALYGDLSDALSHPHEIKIYHGLVSFKIIHPADPHDPEMYGAVTEHACSTPVIDFPENPRVYCLSVTDKSRAFKGRPSTWSAAIDKVTFGRVVEDSPQLMIVSGGNVNYLLPSLDATHYPDHNLVESIHDPAQSYNALTVGAYTRKDQVDQHIYPGIAPLGSHGGMSPSNSTSLIWDDQWPIKPDIVMEGGNLARQNNVITDIVHTLKPLSLDKEFAQYVFNPFGDTSGAAALAAKLAAEIRTIHPEFWPETVKALMVHSAEWTESMLNGINLSTATVAQKRTLLRSFGFGVPIEDKIYYSAKNAVTLIAQNNIQPFRLEGSASKTNEFHLYEIPWPLDVLQNQLTETDVTLKVTLSYFIDPNPGERRYANNFSYHSHALDFKMIRPTEEPAEFRRRVSAAEENQEAAFSGQEEPWLLKESVRNKGGIKKDFIVSSGADLATRNLMAVYPKNGWYNLRKRLGLTETVVRYSLIISLETSSEDINLYNPIKAQIDNLLMV